MWLVINMINIAEEMLHSKYKRIKYMESRRRSLSVYGILRRQKFILWENERRRSKLMHFVIIPEFQGVLAVSLRPRSMCSAPHRIQV